MKLIIALTILACTMEVFALSNYKRDKLQRYSNECFYEAGVDLKQITRTKGDVTRKSKVIQCLAKCIFEKVGIFDKAGSFQETLAKEVLSIGNDKIKVDSAVRQCKTVKGASPCETAHLLYECFKTYV